MVRSVVGGSPYWFFTVWERSVSPDVMRSSGILVSPPTGRREVVMRYDEKEEIEATGEWLMRIRKVGFSEELEYVPSKLSKLGVAPIDVVDRQVWLRSHYHDSIVLGSGTSGIVVEEQEIPVVLDKIEVEDPVGELDYVPWEWADGIDEIMESIKSVFAQEPGLHQFNELVILATSKKRRGKTERMRNRSASDSEKAIA